MKKSAGVKRVSDETIKKSVSFVTVACFLLQQLFSAPLSYAQTLGVAPGVNLPAQIEIPGDLGTIEGTSLSGQADRLIVHIQTAHGSYEAQEKIHALLKYLADVHHFDLLLLEGAQGELQPGLFNFFPQDKALNLKIAQDLTQRAELTGPELFLIQSSMTREGSRMKGIGIEDIPAYRENREAFQEVIRARESSGNFLKQMDLQIERLTAPYLNAALKNYLRQFEAHETGKVGLIGWLHFLREQASQHLALDFSNPLYQKDWPMLVRFSRLEKIESKLDASRLEGEKEAFLEKLQALKADPRLTAKLSGLLEDACKQTAGTKFEYSGALGTLRDLAAVLPEDFSFKPYENLKLRLQYLIFEHEMDSALLLSEIERLETMLGEKLAPKEIEQKLLRLFHDYRLLKKLFALQLTQKDYEGLLAGARAAKPSAIAEHFEGLNPDKRVKNASMEHLNEIDGLFDLAMSFYAGALQRDRLMGEHVLEAITRLGKERAVIVTGGFHSQGMKRYFEEKGFSYYLVSPKISQEIDTRGYLQAMMDGEEIEISQIENILKLQPLQTMIDEGMNLDHLRRAVTEALVRNADAAALASRLDDILLRDQYRIQAIRNDKDPSLLALRFLAPAGEKETVLEIRLPETGKPRIAETASRRSEIRYPKTTRLGFEQLEDRRLLSGSNLIEEPLVLMNQPPVPAEILTVGVMNDSTQAVLAPAGAIAPDTASIDAIFSSGLLAESAAVPVPAGHGPETLIPVGDFYVLKTSDGRQFGPEYEAARIKIPVPSGWPSDAYDSTGLSFNSFNNVTPTYGTRYVTLTNDADARFTSQLALRFRIGARQSEDVLPDYIAINGKFTPVTVTAAGQNPIGWPVYDISFHVSGLRRDGTDILTVRSFYDDAALVQTPKILKTTYYLSPDAKTAASFVAGAEAISPAYVSFQFPPTAQNASGFKSIATGLSPDAKIDSARFGADGKIFEITSGAQTVRIDVAAGTVVTEDQGLPPVPAGWTRTASNSNYAFMIAENRPPTGYATITRILKLQDLRTGQIQDVATTYASPSGQSVFTPGYDVSPENTPGGPVVIYGTYSANASGRAGGSIYARRVVNPGTPLYLSGTLQGFSFSADNTSAAIEMAENFTPAGITGVAVIRLSDVSVSEKYAKITPGSGLRADADTPIVIADYRTGTGGYEAWVYDAGQGTNHLQLLGKVFLGSDSSGAITLKDAYQTPSGRQIVSAGLDADHFNTTIIRDPRTNQQLQLDGAATAVSYQGKQATYTLRNQDNTTRQVAVNLDTFETSEVINRKPSQTSPDGRYSVEHRTELVRTFGGYYPQAFTRDYLTIRYPDGTSEERLVANGQRNLEGFSVVNRGIYLEGNQRGNWYLEFVTFANFKANQNIQYQFPVTHLPREVSEKMGTGTSIDFVAGLPGVADIRGVDFVTRRVDLEKGGVHFFGLKQIGTGTAPVLAADGVTITHRYHHQAGLELVFPPAQPLNLNGKPLVLGVQASSPAHYRSMTLTVTDARGRSATLVSSVNSFRRPSDGQVVIAAAVLRRRGIDTSRITSVSIKATANISGTLTLTTDRLPLPAGEVRIGNNNLGAGQSTPPVLGSSSSPVDQPPAPGAPIVTAQAPALLLEPSPVVTAQPVAVETAPAVFPLNLSTVPAVLPPSPVPGAFGNYMALGSGGNYTITNGLVTLTAANEIPSVNQVINATYQPQTVSNYLHIGPFISNSSGVKTFATLKSGGKAVFSDQLSIRSGGNFEPRQNLPNFVQINGRFIPLSVAKTGSNPLGWPQYSVSFTTPQLQSDGTDKIKFLSPDMDHTLVLEYAISPNALIWARFNRSTSYSPDQPKSYIRFISSKGEVILPTGLEDHEVILDYHFDTLGSKLILIADKRTVTLNVPAALRSEVRRAQAETKPSDLLEKAEREGFRLGVPDMATLAKFLMGKSYPEQDGESALRASLQTAIRVTGEILDGIVPTGFSGLSGVGAYVWHNRAAILEQAKALREVELSGARLKQLGIDDSYQADLQDLIGARNDAFAILGVPVPEEVTPKALHELLDDFGSLLQTHHPNKILVLTYQGDLSDEEREKIYNRFDRRVIILKGPHQDLMSLLYGRDFGPMRRWDSQNSKWANRILIRGRDITGENLTEAEMFAASLVVADKLTLDEELSPVSRQLLENNLGLKPADSVAKDILYGLRNASLTADEIKDQPSDVYTVISRGENAVRMIFKTDLGGRIQGLMKAVRSILSAA